MTIDQAFDETVAYYDDWMKRALPGYDDLFGVATDVIPFEKDAPLRVLDLGAGTGLFSEHVRRSFPNAAFVLWDLAEKMLGMARKRFQDHGERFAFVVDDYRNLRDRECFDLVISSLSIHHLTDAEKHALLRQIYRALKDGGAFVHIDQVKGETPYLRNLYWERWLQRVRANGAPEEQIQQSIERRQTYDKDASMADQIQWLKEAGFVNVDCVYKHTFVGVFLAMKGGRQLYLPFRRDIPVFTDAGRILRAQMIRLCTPNDFEIIYEIVNDAAQAYKGVIPADRYHEPYMPREELQHEIDAGVRFWGYEADGELVGVMGIQDVQDASDTKGVALIRHAYVRTTQRRRGIGGKLLTHLRTLTRRPILIGTWAAATWAVRFYEKHGFRLVSEEEKNRLLKKYWSIPERQVETSVVLAEGTTDLEQKTDERD